MVHQLDNHNQYAIKSKSSQGNNFSVGEKTVEICFLNSQFIHDITITPESIAHSIFDISSINKLVIKTDSVTGKFNFNIYGKSDGIILFYSFDQSRFEEINIFKNELLKIIIAQSKKI